MSLRFVILRHEVPSSFQRGSHWDWMFQRVADDPAARLETWATTHDDLDGWLTHGGQIDALALPPHRAIYLDYEGEVSGNRGYVTRKLSGTLEVLHDEPQRKRFRLNGESYQGILELVWSSDEAPANSGTTAEETWQMSWQPEAGP